ncbi:hypothetical protein ACDT12_13520, partial [Staphylococcus aureus]
FKWKVKEATPLNRAGIVHGDIPKYQHVTGDIVNEKTPMSEIDQLSVITIVQSDLEKFDVS